MTMARTKKQLDQAAADAEEWIESVGADDLSRIPNDLIAVTRATEAAAAAKHALDDAVLAARKNGRSWGRIAMHLNVSRQAALQRFGKLEQPKTATAAKA